MQKVAAAVVASLAVLRGLARAVPAALKAGAPGSPEFRRALRDGMEQVKDLYGACAIHSMTPCNHNGTDERALVLITVKDGNWKLIE